ncbi:hypothetical protein BO71DRAFT_113408 [Aspergillus ellipticus CBS 707.79]|uniref:Uncharacterized protein n=1 Tax=Aspergillus ellipticus CBS 707.79 TaxID=1448320 RepID=A0A319EDN5_9EURO|nr:hypothetical protein BO71DRAFT_113408 [Aspergillus ellipticus CBS 707.79]
MKNTLSVCFVLSPVPWQTVRGYTADAIWWVWQHSRAAASILYYAVPGRDPREGTCSKGWDLTHSHYILSAPRTGRRLHPIPSHSHHLTPDNNSTNRADREHARGPQLIRI